MNQNRATLLTAPGISALAVVRFCGPGVRTFLQAHFTKMPKENRCVHGDFRDGQSVIDDPIVVLSRDGSFADVNLHGGAWIVRRVLEMARRAGFEIESSPGEIPLEAAEGQTVLEREVFSSLPFAPTEMALRALLSQPEAWTRLQREAATVVDTTPERAGPLRAQITRMLEDRVLLRLLHPPRVAIVGAANVGKSTLANQLFAQERSITANLPGTTRDWIGEITNIDGLAVMLIDTPGVRDTADSIERAAIEKCREQICDADLIVLVLDATRPLDPEQSPLLNEFPAAIRVANKSDAAPEWDASGWGAIATVATTGQGVARLRQAILSHFDCAQFDVREARHWTARQRAMLEEALHDPAILTG